MINLDKILTEQVNPDSSNIDKVSTEELCKIINNEDKKVAVAVEQAIPNIARGIDGIVERLRQGGRLFYIGAGTSGRLGILDAVECPPTYSTDPELVQGIIAGGYPAIFKAQEGAEDNPELAKQDLQAKNINNKDIVVGVAASGRTPYVLGGLEYARTVGALTIGIACSPNSPISKSVEIMIDLLTGPEVVTGSTRMKAGTAQKLVLNMLSTGSMIKLGKTYGNLMVDVKASNAKLVERAKRIIRMITDCSYERAEELVALSNGVVKVALIMELCGVNAQEAKAMLELKGGSISKCISK